MPTPATSFVLSGSPVESPTGNAFTVTLGIPTTDTAPTGVVTTTDSLLGSATSSTWAFDHTTGPTDFYTATCDITTPEPEGTTVQATYDQSDYTTTASNTLTVGAAVAISLVLSGTPVQSPTGNSFTVVLTIATGDIAPTGVITVEDSALGSATSSTWTGPTSGGGGDQYTASLAITTAEVGGNTVQATYDQSDYTVAASNTLNVTATVTFNKVQSSATGSMANQTEHTATDLTANAFALTNFTFEGWDTSSTGTTVVYADAASFPFIDSTTLYAVWKGDPIVTFLSNDGLSGYSTQEEDYGATVDLTANAFVSPQRTFTHWNTQPDGSGTMYADSASYTFTAPLTLYAQWSLAAGVAITPVVPVSIGVAWKNTNPTAVTLTLGVTVTPSGFTTIAFGVGPSLPVATIPLFKNPVNGGVFTVNVPVPAGSYVVFDASSKSVVSISGQFVIGS